MSGRRTRAQLTGADAVNGVRPGGVFEADWASRVMEKAARERNNGQERLQKQLTYLSSSEYLNGAPTQRGASEGRVVQRTCWQGTCRGHLEAGGAETVGRDGLTGGENNVCCNAV